MSEDPIVALKGQVEALEWQRSRLISNVEALKVENGQLRTALSDLFDLAEKEQLRAGIEAHRAAIKPDEGGAIYGKCDQILWALLDGPVSPGEGGLNDEPVPTLRVEWDRLIRERDELRATVEALTGAGDDEGLCGQYTRERNEARGALAAWLAATDDVPTIYAARRTESRRILGIPRGL